MEKHVQGDIYERMGWRPESLTCCDGYSWAVVTTEPVEDGPWWLLFEQHAITCPRAR